MNLLDQIATFLAGKTSEEAYNIMESVNSKAKDMRAEKLIAESPPAVETPIATDPLISTTTDELPKSAVDTSGSVETPPVEKSTPEGGAKTNSTEANSTEIAKQLAPIIKKLEDYMGNKEKQKNPNNKTDASDDDIKKQLDTKENT